MSSDVFIISAARAADAPTTIRQAVELAGIKLPQMQDAVFGVDGGNAMPDVQLLVQASGLSCPAACISTSLRALFFAAASMLSDDVELSLVIGLKDTASTAFVLASPEAVGRLNLLPRARIAARSLAGPQAALRGAGLAPFDIEIRKTGEQAALLLHELLDELEARLARWGTATIGQAVILVERV